MEEELPGSPEAGQSVRKTGLKGALSKREEKQREQESERAATGQTAWVQRCGKTDITFGAKPLNVIHLSAVKDEQEV